MERNTNADRGSWSNGRPVRWQAVGEGSVVPAPSYRTVQATPDGEHADSDIRVITATVFQNGYQFQAEAQVDMSEVSDEEYLAVAIALINTSVDMAIVEDT